MEAGSIVEALAQPGDLRSLVRRHRRRLRGGALRRRCRLLPELIHPAAQHRVAQSELLRDRPDRSTTRYRQFNGLALVVLGERSTLTFWHSTPPGSLSLLQVSTHSEEVQLVIQERAKQRAPGSSLATKLDLKLDPMIKEALETKLFDGGEAKFLQQFQPG